MPEKERKSEEMRRHEEQGKAKASPQKPQLGREGQHPSSKQQQQQQQKKMESRTDR